MEDLLTVVFTIDRTMFSLWSVALRVVWSQACNVAFWNLKPKTFVQGTWRYLLLIKTGKKIKTEMKLSIFIFLKSGAMIFPGRFSVNICQEFWCKITLLKLIYSSKLVRHKTRVRIWLHLSCAELQSSCSKLKKAYNMWIARNVINGREARKRSASEEFGRDARARNARSTFDKPLACVTGIFDHIFSKPLTWIADKFDYAFDPPLRRIKGSPLILKTKAFTGE